MPQCHSATCATVPQHQVEAALSRATQPTQHPIKSNSANSKSLQEQETSSFLFHKQATGRQLPALPPPLGTGPGKSSQSEASSPSWSGAAGPSWPPAGPMPGPPGVQGYDYAYPPGYRTPWARAKCQCPCAQRIFAKQVGLLPLETFFKDHKLII